MTHTWRLKKWLPERYGQRCKITARGAKGAIRVVFEDNFSVISNRFAVRRLKDKET